MSIPIVGDIVTCRTASLGLETNIIHALHNLNDHYGRGEIREVDFMAMTVRRAVHYAGPRNKLTMELRRFRFDALCNTVYFLRHQRRIK